jgi:hypothetical protein
MKLRGNYTGFLRDNSRSSLNSRTRSMNIPLNMQKTAIASKAPTGSDPGYQDVADHTQIQRGKPAPGSGRIGDLANSLLR